jgi:diguanylate cyclase (GGDEF)-like protein/PAS domain S-box-containing protein
VASKKKAKPSKSSSEIKALRTKLARLEKKYTRLALEKNFLERAMGDLNFHNNAHDGVVYTDASDNIVYANPYFLGMMGVKDKKSILDQPFPDYMWNNSREAKRLFADIKTNGFVREREMALYNREGQPVFAMCSGVVSKDKDGTVLGTEIMFCNITSKRSFQAELVEQHALLDTMLQSTPDPVLVLNSALDIKRSSPAAEKILDLGDNVALANLFTVLAKTDLPKEILRKLEAKFLGDESFNAEIRIKEGHFDLHAAPLNSVQKGWVCVMHDITLRKHTQEMLQHHAFHDVLTQVPNRAYFIDYLQRAILRSKTEPEYRFAILFVDLDNLKRFNDRYGHHIGDEMLINFARRLEAGIRPGDLVSRLGGDEFAVFLDGVKDEASASVIAARIRETLLQPYQLSEQEIANTTASIGIALSGESTSNVEALLRNADQAMYRVKEHGGNNFEIFSDELLAKMN